MRASLDEKRTRDLRAALAGAGAVIFVCSGNMVRSAFAELLARHLGLRIAVASAATTYRNAGLLGETARALRTRGVSEGLLHSFRPTHLEDLSGVWSDRLSGADGTVVLCMSEAHLRALPAGARGWLLEELLGRRNEIPDPVLEGASFDRTFARVAACVEELVRRFEPHPVPRGIPPEEPDR